MDILTKIRALLGGNKTQKRKYVDDEEQTYDSIDLKRHRPSFQKHSIINNQFDIINSSKHIYNSDCYANLKMASYNNGEFKRPTTNGKRKVPDLISMRTPLSDRLHHLHENGPQQTVNPMYNCYGQSEHGQSEREQFRNMPSLYSVQKSYATNSNRINRFNDTNGTLLSSSSHLQPSGNSTMFNSKYNSQSDSIWSNSHLSGNKLTSTSSCFSSIGNRKPSTSFYTNKSAVVQNPPTDLARSSFEKLLARIVPGYNLIASSKKESDTKTSTSDDDNSSINKSSRNSLTIEPVNSLKARFEKHPVLKNNWENDLNDKYSELSVSRRQQIKTEEEISTTAEQKTRESEHRYKENLRKLSIGSLYDYEIDEEEEPANDYPQLNTEQQKQIVRWISGRDTGTVLNSKFNLTISRHDIQTLNWNPLTWLNDEVINFYMELLGERSKQSETLPKVHGMNTFFLPRLIEHGYSAVRRWTRKVDIFQFDIIPVPVHKGIHWCMAIIHMKNKTIKYYDSMGGPNDQAIRALAEYLKSESLDKKKVEFDMSDWKYENVRNIPQQENGSDCGVFSCMYAEFITRNRPIVFSQQHMQYFRMKMIFEICTGQMLN